MKPVVSFLTLLLVSVFACVAFAKFSEREDAVMERIQKVMMDEFGELVDPGKTLDFSLHQVPMRDGVRLRTRVWIPRGGSNPRAAILDRTPYGAVYTAMSLIWTIDDYAIVMQDQRGTGGSGGDFEMWRLDGQDAYDTMEWISQQEWSNGMVFTFGVSADANAVYPQILLQPPWLKAQFPVFGVDNGHDLCFPQGAYRQDLIERWLDGLCNECIQDVIENESDGPFWETLNMTSHYDHVNFPSVHWGGWWDIFLQGQIKAYNGWSKGGSRPERTYLFIDPHGHCYDVVYAAGVSPLGLRLGRSIFREIAYGETHELLDKVGAVTFWVFGPQDELIGPGNYYTTMEEFPEPEYTDYFLQADGTLSTINLGKHSNVTVIADPSNPVPMNGGHNLYGTCGPLDQSSIEARGDVLTFTTNELVFDTAIVGRVEAVLYVSSTANDTDFVVKLTDVYPDGRSLLVTEGVIRMRWRESKTVPVGMTPGHIYEVKVELWNTALYFARNHRIRVDISSSLEPRWSVNPNSGYWLKDEDQGPQVVATNNIFVGGAYPSRVILPMVEDSQIPKMDLDLLK